MRQNPQLREDGVGEILVDMGMLTDEELDAILEELENEELEEE